MRGAFYDELRNLWWRRYPVAARRRGFSSLSAALADGAYLSAWPPLAAFGPPLILVLGVLLGWLHLGSGETYTSSLPTMGLLVLVGSASAGLGLWLTVGYAIGDLFLFKHTVTSGTLFDLVVPLLISYMLLAILTVLNPLVAHGLRRLTVPRALGRGLPRQVIDVILQAVFQALLTFAWVQSTPTLIRPVWTWHNSVPPTTAIQPLQQFGFMLVILAALGGVARMMLEYRAARDPAVLVFAGSVSAEIARTPQQAGLSLPPRVGAVAQAAFLTLMLSGALNDWLDSISFFIVISLVLLGRSELVTRGAGWAALVSRVPLILRVLVAGVLSYLIALQVLTAMWAGTSTFRPVVIGTAASLILFGLLVPGRLAPVARPSAPPPSRVASHAS